jgi:phage baseplate assembly protein W
MSYIFLNKNTKNEVKGIGINIPFNGSTGININYDSKDSIRTNLLNFLLTNRRERIMNSKVGSNLREQIFEQSTENSLEDVREIINNNINTYFPQIKLEILNIVPNLNTINIYIKYSIINTNIVDDIEIIL